MSRNRVEQHPDEYQEDLNPEYEAGENHAPPRYETRPASEIKALHEQLSGLPKDELKQIPVLIAGSRLEQGAAYLDLRNPAAGEFRAMGSMEAGPDNWYVPKSDVDHELWDWLIGRDAPERVGDRFERRQMVERRG
jgi:hypothetical protein